jgi:hypothetical protein
VNNKEPKTQQDTLEEGDNHGGHRLLHLIIKEHATEKSMTTNKCVICKNQCSKKIDDHWHLCKDCNKKYWYPNKLNYSHSSFLDNIFYFKKAHQVEQDVFWNALGLDSVKQEKQV